MAETKEQKAIRYLAERRLIITRVDPGGTLPDGLGRPVHTDGIVFAECRGDGGEVYKLGWDPSGRGRWGCTCEANSKFHRECAHLVALRAVVSRTRKDT